MRFTDEAVVLTRDEVVALLSFNDAQGWSILIENRNCDTGIGRAVAISGQSILVLEPPGTEKQKGAWSKARPGSFLVAPEHLRLWLEKLPEDTPLNEALTIGCKGKLPQLSAAVVNYEELLLGRSVTLYSFDQVSASRQRFAYYEKSIPRWQPSDKIYETLPAWLSPSLFAKLALVQAAAEDDGQHHPIRLQNGPITIKDGETRTTAVRFDSCRSEHARCTAHGVIAGCSYELNNEEDGAK